MFPPGLKAEGGNYGKWVNGKQVAQRVKNWEGAEPTPDEKHACVIMVRGSDSSYKWKKAKCSGHAGFVCKMTRV